MQRRVCSSFLDFSLHRVASCHGSPRSVSGPLSTSLYHRGLDELRQGSPPARPLPGGRTRAVFSERGPRTTASGSPWGNCSKCSPPRGLGLGGWARGLGGCSSAHTSPQVSARKTDPSMAGLGQRGHRGLAGRSPLRTLRGPCPPTPVNWRGASAPPSPSPAWPRPLGCRPALPRMETSACLPACLPAPGRSWEEPQPSLH